MSPIISRVRKWMSHIPVQDPIDRHVAVLLEVMLVGFITLIIITAGINLLITDDIPRLAILTRTVIAILIIGIPLFLLRRGNYGASALVIIRSLEERSSNLETSACISASMIRRR